MSTLFKILHFQTEEHHWSGLTFWWLVLMTDNPLRWDEADRCGVRSNLAPHLNTRGIKYQEMATKWHQQHVLSYVKQETWEDHTDALSIFIQYIWAEWVWAGCWQGRNNVSLHLYSVWRTERGAERGCLADSRESLPSQLNTNLPSPLKHWLCSSVQTLGTLPKSNWALDILSSSKLLMMWE